MKYSLTFPVALMAACVVFFLLTPWGVFPLSTDCKEGSLYYTELRGENPFEDEIMDTVEVLEVKEGWAWVRSSGNVEKSIRCRVLGRIYDPVRRGE